MCCTAFCVVIFACFQTCCPGTQQKLPCLFESVISDRPLCIGTLALRGGLQTALDSSDDHDRWVKIKKQEQRGRKKLERAGVKGTVPCLSLCCESDARVALYVCFRRLFHVAQDCCCMGKGMSEEDESGKISWLW
jgi:hypothetical protein